MAKRARRSIGSLHNAELRTPPRLGPRPSGSADKTLSRGRFFEDIRRRSALLQRGPLAEFSKNQSLLLQKGVCERFFRLVFI